MMDNDAFVLIDREGAKVTEIVCHAAAFSSGAACSQSSLGKPRLIPPR
jgi:hypothetical protein